MPADPPVTADGEIRNERVFAAPRTEVFGAFADPVALARWWGAGRLHE